jgi:UDP-N-acetyl-D-mannosaminuronic acid dehydrogenase
VLTEGGSVKPDISYVVAATRALLPHLRAGNLVIVESTCPVGTTEIVAAEIERAGLDSEHVSIAYCPERVLPGRVMVELIENDRIVGGLSSQATAQVAAFYRTFVNGEVLETDARTAELAKLTENAFRDVNIAFANELSMICDRIGIDVWKLVELVNHHPRVNVLQPGCGVGGHCIAVDPWFIVDAAQEEAQLIRQARIVNDSKTQWVINDVRRHAREFEQHCGRPPLVACMGLSFKPNIDDLRESPAMKVATALKADGVEVLAVEPNLDSHPEWNLTSTDEAVTAADIIVFLVRHDAFVGLTVCDKKVLDFCGFLGHGRSKARPLQEAQIHPDPPSRLPLEAAVILAQT